ncbi:MAG: hypothetical protein K2O00_01665 [Muribaculaceae bacterium]|nr:hypothetical protein [Muribaculaceae bacterium]
MNTDSNIRSKLDKFLSFFIEPIGAIVCLLIQYGIAWLDENSLYLHINYLGYLFIFLCIIKYLYHLLKAKSQKLRNNKIIKSCYYIILIGVGLYPLILFFLKIFFPFLMSPVISMYILYHTYIYLFILQSLTLVGFLFYWIFRKHGIHPIVRMISIILGELFPIVGLIGNILMLINGNSLFKEGWDDGIILDALIMSIVVYSFLIFPIFLDNRKLYAFIPFRKYILYLSSFSDRKDLNVCLFEIDNKRIPIIEIAEPTGKGAKIEFNGYDFYLPGRNWKPQVKYYISRAQYVICKLGVTEGVQWEMFENDPYLYKYIFFVNNIEQISLDTIDSKYLNHELYLVLKEARVRFNTGSVCFCYHNGYWYFSNQVSRMVNCFIKSEFSEFNNKFESTLSINSNNRNLETHKYWFTDIFRYLWRFVRPQSLAKLCGTPIALIFVLIMWIFPILLILGSIFFIACIGLNYMGINVPCDNDLSLGGAIFCLFLGIYFLREETR